MDGEEPSFQLRNGFQSLLLSCDSKNDNLQWVYILPNGGEL